jgi:hypothetical protein
MDGRLMIARIGIAVVLLFGARVAQHAAAQETEPFTSHADIYLRCSITETSRAPGWIESDPTTDVISFDIDPIGQKATMRQREFVVGFTARVFENAFKLDLTGEDGSRAELTINRVTGRLDGALTFPKLKPKWTQWSGYCEKTNSASLPRKF